MLTESQPIHYGDRRLGPSDVLARFGQDAWLAYRDLGDRHYEAATLIRLGDTSRAADDHSAAHTSGNRL